MREAVIVSTARTGLAKSVRGGFNMTHGAALGGHAIKHAVERAKIDPKEVEDVYLGCANPEGATGGNIARQAALWADMPVSVAGATINRFCSSGLNAIALAAHQIRDGADIMVGGGVESISLVQFAPPRPLSADGRNRALDEKLLAKIPAIYMTMIETAEIVARAAGLAPDAGEAPEAVLATVPPRDLVISLLLRSETMFLFAVTLLIVVTVTATEGAGGLLLILVTGGLPLLAAFGRAKQVALAHDLDFKLFQCHGCLKKLNRFVLACITLDGLGQAL